MIFSENRYPSPIGVEDMLFGIMLSAAAFEQARIKAECRSGSTHGREKLIGEPPRAGSDRPIGRGFGGQRIGDRACETHRIVRLGKPSGARGFQNVRRRE